MSQKYRRIQDGQRVRCQKQGAYNGQVGTVEDVWCGQVLVYFETSAIIEPIDCFEHA